MTPLPASESKSFKEQDENGVWWCYRPPHNRTRCSSNVYVVCENLFIAEKPSIQTCSWSCRNRLLGRKKEGQRNPQWRGGVRLNDSGYILIYSPGHPAADAKWHPYVQEHRLVMEKQLGRYLEPHEEVHHKNGIKTDNRLENLELWTRSHPRGQRVSDQVEWALEIIEKYGNDPSRYKN